MQRVVIRPRGCWIWTGGKRRGAARYPCKSRYYGIMSIRRGEQRKAHRVSYELFNDAIPEGLQIDHRCRNTLCVNPRHLEAVTHRENLRRGRSTKLTPEKVQAIRARISADHTFTSIADDFGVNPQTIRGIATGRLWRDSGPRFPARGGGRKGSNDRRGSRTVLESPRI